MRRILLSLLILFGIVFTATAQDEPVRSIINVTGDLYRFQNNNHYGVFLVTDEGIILADPINADTATWLKGELKERFDKEVKLVIYSHDHADHISGGEVFADTAVFAAHENASPKIEAGGHTIPPDYTFEDELVLELGGRKVGLYYPGPSHSDNLISILFLDEKALFQVDSVAVQRLPYRNLPDYHFPDAIDSLEKVSLLDFEILIPGHGQMGTKNDVTEHHDYLVELYEQVTKAMLKGLSLSQAQEKIALEDFEGWTQYAAWKNLNIEGMYRIMEDRGGVIEHEFKYKGVGGRSATWIGPADYHPKPLVKVFPNFPRKAFFNNTCGWVIVGFDITENGQTENLEVIGSEPKGVLEKAALDAIEEYLFEPGFPVESNIETITFRASGACRVNN